MPAVPKELKGLIPPRRITKGKNRPKITESSRKKFKKEFLEEYRKEESNLSTASDKIGFSRQVLYKWASTDPEFAVEFEELRFMKQGKTKKEFDKKHKNDEKYKKKFLELYSDDSYSVASALEEISKNINGSDFNYWQKTDFEFKKQYKMLQKKTRPTRARASELKSAIISAEVAEKQNRFLQAFTENRFNITNACKTIGIKRSTVNGWCNANPDFRAALEVAQDEKEDWCEDKLLQLVDQGNMPATIFLAKILLQKRNLGRRHAYIEQPQKIEGRIDHVHQFDQDQLDAMVRGKTIDRGKYKDMLQLNDPDIIDVECTEEENNG